MSIKVYFATNRERDGNKNDFSGDFSPKGPGHLRFGWAEVVRESADDYSVKSVHIAKEDIKKIDDPRERWEKSVLGSKTVFESMRSDMQQDGRDVLCLLHGFAADFKTALARCGEIANDYSQDKPLVPFVFTWPANGSMTPWLDYFSDRQSAAQSGPAVARTFKKLVDFLSYCGPEAQCRQSVHLVAHSMGNWALQNAVDDIFEQYGNQPPRMFNNIFLMAADADNDAFEEATKLKNLPHLCKAVHVYFSEDDRALMVSDLTKFNPDRLGATGPLSRDRLPRKVNLIDCQHVDEPDRVSEEKGKQWDLSVHQYYRLRREVIDDVQQVLRGVAPRDVVGRRYVEDDRSFQIVPIRKRVAAR